jgi:hypothetical protein
VFLTFLTYFGRGKSLLYYAAYVLLSVLLCQERQGIKEEYMLSILLFRQNGSYPLVKECYE